MRQEHCVRSKHHILSKKVEAKQSLNWRPQGTEKSNIQGELSLYLEEHQYQNQTSYFQEGKY